MVYTNPYFNQTLVIYLPVQYFSLTLRMQN